jgi:monoamine oxidase
MPTPISLPAAHSVDVAIVGAGLCGLALARVLTARGLRVQVLEARSRLGGRVLTAHCEATQQALDLGPTWFWPETEPRITALLAELGLPGMPQHDPGDALWLSDPNRAPERHSAAGGVHAGSRRIQGGAARLVDALAATLPPDTVRMGAPVKSLHDCGNHIEMTSTSGPALRARQVVLALPPRLVREHIQFQPSLPQAVLQALEDSPTWMAAQAKAVTTFGQAFWRAAGQSGNAFVRHPQAVLAEVFDCCAEPVDSSPQAGALGGFIALNAAQREQFRRSLPLLIDSQLAQLYGVQAQGGNLFLQDWATETWTCSTSDRTKPPEPPQADPLLRQALWDGRVFFGGSETATHGAGHMEGALESADRIAHALVRAQQSAAGTENMRNAARVSATAKAESIAAVRNTRAAAIGAFSAGVLSQRTLAPQRYRLHLTRLLAAQNNDLLTQRALLATVDQCYSEALALLDPLLAELDAANADVVNGRHALSAALLAPFEGWNKDLLDAALAHNASSCALSNFPQEHQPDADSLRAITLDLAAAWREFALEINTRLLVAAEAGMAA